MARRVVHVTALRSFALGYLWLQGMLLIAGLLPAGDRAQTALQLATYVGPLVAIALGVLRHLELRDWWLALLICGLLTLWPASFAYLGDLLLPVFLLIALAVGGALIWMAKGPLLAAAFVCCLTPLLLLPGTSNIVVLGTPWVSVGLLALPLCGHHRAGHRRLVCAVACASVGAIIGLGVSLLVTHALSPRFPGLSADQYWLPLLVAIPALASATLVAFGLVWLLRSRNP